MIDVTNSEAWRLIKEQLEEQLENASHGLQVMENTREKDLLYKAKIAVVKELIKLPQVITLAANTKRNT